MEYSEYYKFCPRCKSELSNDSGLYFKCPACDFYFYVNPVPCNAVILENIHGEILLVKRKFDPKKNFWDVPGGFMKTGETVEESVQRELREELGTEAQNLQYIASYPDRYLYKNIHFYTIGMVFTGKITDTLPEVKDDISAALFFRKNEIPYDEIAFPSVVLALKQYLHVK